ncbi:MULTISPECIES: hypothetical protein [Bacillus]|uniref:Uncharacterized protein n=1 Tax=Bacillus salipaludis TaxID=2547811 RepID=A0AA90QSE1_9BACI|nr:MULTISPECIES: hypothetical protein [Bacillus]MDQ6595639.1 hypothetical protein [Bacillus salipaludis]
MNMIRDLVDKCISCHQELAPCERNRSECLDCRDKTIEAYGDDSEE